MADKVPTNADLVACGMYDYCLRAGSVEPPPTARGIQRGMVAKTWICSITSFDASRPMVRAIRDNPEDADKSARIMFADIFKGKKIDPVSVVTANTKQAKPAKKMELDDEAASLI